VNYTEITEMKRLALKHMEVIYNKETDTLVYDRKLKDGSWVCGLITSEPECTEILEPCKSRFFSDNYFTKVQFTATVPIGRFMGVFGNPKQVKEYGEKLQKLFA
jgi:hypothetical protein